MITILAFIFVIGVLVFIHELGHFLVARAYGVRVITFSLGFGPKLLKARVGGTEYAISAIPLGGYVKLAGETVEDERSGAPDEFLSKSKFVRFQVYLAGPVMNVVLAIVVLGGVLWRGADVPLYQSSAPVIGSIAQGSVAEKAGLQVGDLILQVDGQQVATWDAMDEDVMPRANQQLDLTVRRGGERLNVKIVPAAVGRFEIGDLGIGPVMRPQFLSVTPDGPADHAGLKAGDVVIALAGDRRVDRQSIIDKIQQSEGVPLAMTIERAGVQRDVSVTPVKKAGSVIIGVQVSAVEVRHVDPSFGRAMVMSVQQNWDTTKMIGRTFRGLFTARTPVRQLIGPVAIAQLSGDAAQLGWLPLLQFMALISLNLGMVNLLPIPIFDGGHIAILAFEGAARRELSVRVKERILLAGAAVIALLMVTAIYNDVMRLLK